MASLIQRGIRKLRREWTRRSAVFRFPLRVGIIGYGGIAPEHLDGYESTGQARIVGVSDLLPANLARALDRCPAARAYLDFRQMLEETRPDVVSICTWPQAHAEAVEAAAAAGVRGILCEKPLALQLADLERMRAACQGRAVKLAGGHQYRFHRNYMRAAEIIRSGGLGKVVGVRGNIKSTLANNGPHLIDTVRFLLGDPAAVRVTCRCRRERGEFNRGLPAEDAATGEIFFSDGLRFEFSTGDLAPDFFKIIVEGLGGSLEVTPQDLRVDGALCTPRGATGDDCRRRQFREFILWVKGRRGAYAADVRAEAQAAELVLALYESARLDHPLELPLANRGDVIGKLYPALGERSSAAVPASPCSPPPAAARPDERLAMAGGRRAVSKWFSNRPTLGARELAKLTRVILSGNLSCTGGRMVAGAGNSLRPVLRQPARSRVDFRHGRGPRRLGALGLNPGDEVITTPITDMGTIIPILACNCLPVFADVDPETGNLTAETIAVKLTPRTKAVVLVHLFGRPADLGPICDLLRDRKIPLIEDCARPTTPSTTARRSAPSGTSACFSFQQSKQITCGDGGMTLVNRAELAERAALFVDKGWDRKRGVRSHLFLGMNYRMTELQGAVALAQLERLPRLIRARRVAAEDLACKLRSIPGVLAPPEQAGVDPSWWMFPFRIDEEAMGVRTDEFRDALAVEGVPAQRQYLPVPLFEYDMLKYQRTYGDSGYPFTAFPYEPPDPADFAGFHAFNHNLLFFAWNQSARPRHAAAIAAAVGKVASLLPARRDVSRRPILNPELSAI